MPNPQWQPTASIQTLRRRAEILAEIRRYFQQHQVLEVETPILSSYGGTDVNLDAWQTAEGLTLHTSPEFAMKRLLAAGSGDIYQICRVFRQDEQGQRHQPEFTMLEWYRVGFQENELMDDVATLIEHVSGIRELPRQVITYAQAFEAQGLPDPHRASLDMLQAAVRSRLNAAPDNWKRDECLDALMAMVVEPSLPAETLVFVQNFPSSQAALAQHSRIDGVLVARRFELFWGGMELANGYYELTDAQEQAKRFEQDCQDRLANGQAIPKLDERFLAALSQGMPECSGVALGLDRLIMKLLGKAHIDEVVAFPLAFN
ncbi:EF-P lysine aminoacylase EpmA [Reinekea blandensis]|uniref:Lysyl-tRNA synthetase n=1 Tax=Reinekea blandensis MED297 TaxID=314283 RepID=A4BE55_9GAMM|nr:EF-P lysine aminoacylase EpmA [Reinekea blandensis]EAR09533.1 lysyl-tRNA synthetase [Reinekea blandensis MED297]